MKPRSAENSCIAETTSSVLPILTSSRAAGTCVRKPQHPRQNVVADGGAPRIQLKAGRLIHAPRGKGVFDVLRTVQNAERQRQERPAIVVQHESLADSVEESRVQVALEFGSTPCSSRTATGARLAAAAVVLPVKAMARNICSWRSVICMVALNQ